MTVSVATECREKIVDSVIAGRTYELATCLRALEKLQVTKLVLAETGIGFLIADSSLWELAKDSQVSRRAAALKLKWAGDLKCDPLCLDVGDLAARNRPFAGNVQGLFYKL